MPDTHCGGHLASLYLLFRALGLIFARIIDVDKNEEILYKAWQKLIMDDSKQTIVARYTLWRTYGITLLAF